MSESPAASTRAPRRAVLNVLLACAGLGLFAYLVRASGVTMTLLRGVGLGAIFAIFAVFGLVVLFDTAGWYYAIRHAARPRASTLFRLRVAGDALTNGLPGGVVLGETFKAVMLRRLFAVSYADGAATLLTVKLAQGLSQAVFVFIGLGLSYPQLKARSQQLFGFQGAQYVALGLTLGMAFVMLLPVALMVRGDSFSGVVDVLARMPSERLRRVLARWRPRMVALDAACVRALRGNRRHLGPLFVFLLAGWLASALECYVLLSYLGARPTLSMAYVIESVGSMFRLIFFMVPSGIGGQDASFLALFRLYDLPLSTGGVFVLVKRFKELLWIGLGLLLVVYYRRSSRASS